MFNQLYTHPLEKIVSDKVEKICDSYNTSIVEAKSAHEKIEIIAKHVQLILQLHPLKDGNSRMANLLVNRLLHEENLPLTLLLNPNRLEYFSVNQIVKMIEKGQQDYLEFTRNRIPKFEDEYLLETPKIIPTAIPDIEEELSGFTKIVKSNLACLREMNKENNKVYDPRIFSNQHKSETEKTSSNENISHKKFCITS